MTVQTNTTDRDFLESQIEHFNRILAFLARRTQDPDHAQVLALDVLRTAWAAEAGPDGPGFNTLLVAAAGTAAAAANRADAALAQQDSVSGAVASLGSADREILRLVYWDNVSMAELAGFLGCSISTAGRRLGRAYGKAERRLRRLGRPPVGRGLRTLLRKRGPR